MQWMRFANLVLFVINIALFMLWWSLIKVDAAPDKAIAEYASSQISILITVLGVIIGAGALILAGLAFFGFQTVLERAEIMADKTARDVLARLEKDGSLYEKAKVPTQSAHLPDVGTTTEAKD